MRLEDEGQTIPIAPSYMVDEVEGAYLDSLAPGNKKDRAELRRAYAVWVILISQGYGANTVKLAQELDEFLREGQTPTATVTVLPGGRA